MSNRIKRLWSMFAVLAIFGMYLTHWTVSGFQLVPTESPLADLVNQGPLLLWSVMIGTLACGAFLVWDAQRRERLAGADVR